MPPEVTTEEWTNMAQAAAQPGIYYHPGFKERVGQAADFIRTKRILGRPIPEIVADMLVGFTVKQTVRTGVMLAGASTLGAFGVAVAAGAVSGGVLAGGREWVKQARENWQQPLSPDAITKRQQLLERLKDLCPNDWKRLGLVTLRGAVVGAAGGFVGAVVADAFHALSSNLTPEPTIIHTPTAVDTVGPEGIATIPPAPQEEIMPLAPQITPQVELSATTTPITEPTPTPISTPTPTIQNEVLTPTLPEITSTPEPTPLPTTTPLVEPNPLITTPTIEEPFSSTPGVSGSQFPFGDQFPKADLAEPTAPSDTIQSDTIPAEQSPTGDTIVSGENKLPSSPVTQIPEAEQPPSGLVDTLTENVQNLKDVSLEPGDNPWKVATQLLKQANPDHTPTNAEIMKVAKIICEENNIKVPEWGVTGSVDHRAIPVGYVLKLNPEVKSVITSVLKGDE